MKTVLFSHPKETLPLSTLLPGKVELFQKLEDRDVTPVITLNAESAFAETNVEAYQLVDEHTVRPIAHVALENTGAIVNRLDRSFKRDRMPESWNDARLPTYNENELRSLVFRKHRAHEEVLQPLDLGMETALVESVSDAAVFMEANPSAAYIAKPTSGTFSKGVERLSAREVMPFFADNQSLLGTTILQPAYDFSLPFPETIRPYDAASLSGFETWARSSAMKELRMYGFYSDGQTSVIPAARAMKDGEDHWFFVDPESLPDKLFDDTKHALSRAAQVTASRAIYAALDIGYGARDAQAPDYHVIELNGRMPYMIGYDKHAAVADQLRTTFADHIAHSVQ
jgi:hypothetical protein